jgi:hypothetical protein
VQREIRDRGSLLDGCGHLRERGYSWAPLLEYDRRAIRAAPWRIKEWDFYQIQDREICMQFTIGHASYIGQAAFTLFELGGGARYSKSITRLLPFASMGMPPDSERGLSCQQGPSRIEFVVESGARALSCRMEDSAGELEARVELEERSLEGTRLDSMNIATPFRESPRDFYCNRKISGMRARGFASIRGSGGKRRYELGREAYGILDWGRGVWPYRHEWLWGSGAALVEGEVFSFNVGQGFGDTSLATENAFFYAGKGYKLGELRIETGGDDRLAPWSLSSDDGLLELEQRPSYDNSTATKLLFVDNSCHQVFGRFDGRARLPEGRELRIENMAGFCEHARNRW